MFSAWHHWPCGLGILWLALLVAILSGCQPERQGGPLYAGDTAPDFAVRALDGQVTVLSSLAGRPVLVRFFETNCRYCKADTPTINQFYLANRDRGLHVLYIGAFYEGEQAIRGFVEELGVAFPVALDSDARLANLYNVKLYPQTFMIGPDGVILANLFGGVGEGELSELLGPHLQ